MKNTKLYVLQNNGIVKLGITSNEDVQTRITQINKNLPKDKKFELVVHFEVNESPAMIERLIHDHLGVNQLNIQYLKNKMVLVDFDYLNSTQTGYTEFFLADKDKIKQVITLFGILNYIDVSQDELKKLNSIKEYSFDFFANKHPEFLKMCESAIRINQNGSNYIKSTLVEALSSNSDKIKADFIIEDNRYFLLLGDKKISVEELTNPNNKKNIEYLLKNKDVLEIEHKENDILYSIIKEFREKNKETSLQPLTSIQKERKEKKIKKWLNNKNGNKKIADLVSSWDGSNVPFSYDLVGVKNYLLNINQSTLEDEKNLTIKEKQLIEKNKKELSNPKLFEANFNSPLIFPDFYKFIEKENYLINAYGGYHDMLQSANMISAIYKILYRSKDPEEEFKKIEIFMDYMDDFYKFSSDKTHTMRYIGPSWKLEEQISNFIKKDSNYLDLAEAEIRIYDDGTKNQKKALNKIKNL